MTKKKLILFLIFLFNFVGFIAPQKALANYKCEGIHLSQERNGKDCYGCIEKSGNLSIKIDKITAYDMNWNEDTKTPVDGKVDFRDGGLLSIIVCRGVRFKDGKMLDNCTFPLSELKIDQSRGGNDFSVNVVGSDKMCTINFIAQDDCKNQCEEDQVGEYDQKRFKLCEQVQSSQQAYDDCMACVGSATSPKGVWTAIGCIPTNRDSIFKVLMQLGLGLGGGFALITILAASFQLSVSQGDPKQTGDAKDKITAAVIGLLFIIFSITILQFIGVKVLQIPGFGN